MSFGGAARRSFGDVLREHRGKLGLTQEELAERAGLSTRAISDLERGVKLRPRRTTVELLSNALGLDETESERLSASVPSRAKSAHRDAEAPSNLPASLTSFVGRRNLTNDLARRLLVPEVRLLTLTGVGGCGKTRLALEAAGMVKGEFADGVCFVGLDRVSSASDVLAAVATAISTRDELGTLSIEPGEYLREREALVILDNFEHVLKAKTTVHSLLESCPKLTVLVTSRVVLDLYGEHVLEVPPMSLPGEMRDESSEAVELFVQRVKAFDPEFNPNQEDTQVVETICRELDGLPLAIELAAGRSRNMSPTEILERLDAPLGFLGAGPVNMPERQRTLRRTLEWSYELLDDGAKEVFVRIGVFYGGFRSEAAEVVCGLGREDVVGDLHVLADSNLVSIRRSTSGGRRFEMLRTIREFALELLAGSGDQDETKHRHAHYHTELAESAATGLFGAEAGLWSEVLASERANIRAGLEWARESGEADLGLRLCASLWRWWMNIGYVVSGLTWIETFLGYEGAGPTETRAEALNGAGILAYQQVRYDESRTFLEECLTLRKEVGDEVGAARAYGNLATVAQLEGKLEEAKGLYERCVEILERDPDSEAWLIGANGNLAGLELVIGEFAAARDLLESNLRRISRLGLSHQAAYTLNDLGVAALYEDRPEEALEFFEDGVRRAEEAGNPMCAMESKRRAGLALLPLGRIEEAVDVFREGLVAMYEVEEIQGTIECLESLGCAACAGGDHARARALWALTTRMRSRYGIAVYPTMIRLYDGWRTRMPHADYEEIPDDGIETLEEAIDYALE